MDYDIIWPYIEGVPLQDFFDDDRFQLMQYTGLKDKNDREIYEGDIVQDNFGCGQIEYSPPGFLVDTGDPLRFWLGGGKEYPPNFSLKDTEVIGDIYNNPDLIKTT
jgi:hypothetical protein